MDKIRLVLASEDSSARRGLRAIFTSEGMFEVLGAYALNEAIEKSIVFQPDALLIDISGDFARCGQKVAEAKKECPCSLIIAMMDGEQSDRLADMIYQGIDSCVPRGIMRGCLVKTVKLACRAGILCLPGSFKKKMLSVGEENPAVTGPSVKTTNGKKESLTRREMEILQLMATNYSNREIAGKLYISEPTVKTHVSSILRKLGQNNRAQAVVYSYKIGLVKDLMVVHEQ